MCSSAVLPTEFHPHPPNLSVPSCVPSDDISVQAYCLAQKHLPSPILNHSLRVWVYAQTLVERELVTSISSPLLFTACILHDIGATSAFANIDFETQANGRGLQRFEIEGADAAVDLLRTTSKGISEFTIDEAAIEEVWRAIALHTSPQIAERMGGMVRVVRLAVLRDFGRADSNTWGDLRSSGREGHRKGDDSRDTDDGLNVQLEGTFPRLDIEKTLGDAVVTQALSSGDPEKKAPAASWPNNLLKAHWEDPEWAGVSKGF